MPESKDLGWIPQTEQPGEAPTHVVGSQGRRGILPSAPGGTGAGKNTIIPVKDADGKFPCSLCAKIYRHAKHLKRYLLSHTNNHSYKCVLCCNTLSRLKRHFKNCSIRRGKSTLLQRGTRGDQNNIAAYQRLAGAEGDMNHVNGMNNMPPSDEWSAPCGMAPVSDMQLHPGMNGFNEQNQLIRSSSMGNDDTPDRRSQNIAIIPSSRHG